MKVEHTFPSGQVVCFNGDIREINTILEYFGTRGMQRLLYRGNSYVAFLQEDGEIIRLDTYVDVTVVPPLELLAREAE